MTRPSALLCGPEKFFPTLHELGECIQHAVAPFDNERSELEDLIAAFQSVEARDKEKGKPLSSFQEINAEAEKQGINLSQFIDESDLAAWRSQVILESDLGLTIKRAFNEGPGKLLGARRSGDVEKVAAALKDLDALTPKFTHALAELKRNPDTHPEVRDALDAVLAEFQAASLIVKSPELITREQALEQLQRGRG